MHLAIILDDKHLSILDTLDLALAFLKGGDLREGGKVFQLVLLGHGSESAGVWEVEVGCVDSG